MASGWRSLVCRSSPKLVRKTLSLHHRHGYDSTSSAVPGSGVSMNLQEDSGSQTRIEVPNG